MKFFAILIVIFSKLNWSFSAKVWKGFFFMKKVTDIQTLKYDLKSPITLCQAKKHVSLLIKKQRHYMSIREKERFVRPYNLIMLWVNHKIKITAFGFDILVYHTTNKNKQHRSRWKYDYKPCLALKQISANICMVFGNICWV